MASKIVDLPASLSPTRMLIPSEKAIWNFLKLLKFYIYNDLMCICKINDSVIRYMKIDMELQSLDPSVSLVTD